MESDLAGLVMILFAVVLVAVVCVLVTRKAADGGLDHNNGGVGIRTRHTQASDEAWRAGHAAALPAVTRIGWVATATVALAVAAHVSFGGSWGIFVGLGGMLVEVVVLLFAAGAANKAAEAAG